MTAEPTLLDAIAEAEAETHARLSLVADPGNPVGRDTEAAFLAACKADAEAHGGRVSVSRVSAALPEDITSTERYSSLWSAFTGPNKPMRRVYTVDAEGNKRPVYDFREGSRSGNDGKPTPARQWVGWSA
jgi:hypothetical protein